MLNWGDRMSFKGYYDAGGDGLIMTKGEREELVKISSTEINAVKRLMLFLRNRQNSFP
jgi:hypothetical protein